MTWLVPFAWEPSWVLGAAEKSARKGLVASWGPLLKALGEEKEAADGSVKPSLDSLGNEGWKAAKDFAESDDGEVDSTSKAVKGLQSEAVLEKAGRGWASAEDEEGWEHGKGLKLLLGESEAWKAGKGCWFSKFPAKEFCPSEEEVGGAPPMLEKEKAAHPVEESAAGGVGASESPLLLVHGL